MLTLALNAAIVFWAVLLLMGPAVALALRGRLTAATLAGTSTFTLVAICLVAYLAALAGYGTIGPLRACVVVLSLILIWDVLQGVQLVRGVRAGQRTWPTNSDLSALPVGLLVGIWMIASPLLALGNLGERFGLATAFNADLSNYVLAATNVAEVGFRNSNHLAGLDVGSFSQHASYMGATALMNFTSAATGLASWKAAMATMGVAICLSVVALWALAKAVWPAPSSRAAAAVVIASFSSMSSYLVSEYFLGGVLAVVSVATSLAGATMLTRRGARPPMAGVLAMAAGGALGVFSYGHLGLPILLLLPIWSAIVCWLSGRRHVREFAVVAAWSAGSAALGLALSAVALPTAWSLVRAQSTVAAGWPMPPLGAEAMLTWPADVLQPSSTFSLVSSWTIVAIFVILGLWASWFARYRDSVLITSVFTIGSLIVVFGCTVIYGPARYQTWKMESFLLPFVMVMCLPALGELKFGRKRPGPAILLVGVGLVLLSPVLSWQPVVGRLQANHTDRAAASVSTTPGLVGLADSAALARLSSVNVALGSFFETMAAASILPTRVLILSSPSYYAAATSTSTCTLTRRDMLAPGESVVTDLGGGYVLVPRPTVCAVTK